MWRPRTCSCPERTRTSCSHIIVQHITHNLRLFCVIRSRPPAGLVNVEMNARDIRIPRGVPCTLTQRGRGEHLFWIHTQSPPPDCGLSVQRRVLRHMPLPTRRLAPAGLWPRKAQSRMSPHRNVPSRTKRLDYTFPPAGGEGGAVITTPVGMLFAATVAVAVAFVDDTTA